MFFVSSNLSTLSLLLHSIEGVFVELICIAFSKQTIVSIVNPIQWTIKSLNFEHLRDCNSSGKNTHSIYPGTETWGSFYPDKHNKDSSALQVSSVLEPLDR